MKSLLKQFIPPVFFDLAGMISPYGWHGDYRTWGEALRHCGGYDAPVILEKCKNALLKVKRGEAVYERDSVVFDRIEYSWPALAGLLRCAAEHDGCLHVLDFGGSLGSSYYQNRLFLSSLKTLTWSIVEQPHFVACGKECFQDDVLKFYESIEACIIERTPNVLLLSSVLQYLPDPARWIERFVSLGIEYIVIDRTAFVTGGHDRIMVQRVPPSIYAASYPSRAFEENEFLALFESYRLISDFQSLDRSNLADMYFKGFVLQKKDF